MTSLAFILGAVPLVLATGAGANSRHSIGTGIVGGMTAATVLAIFFVPLFYRLFQGMREDRRQAGDRHHAGKPRLQREGHRDA